MVIDSRNRGRSLRIVHVSPGYAPLVSGAERLLQAVSERLVQRGHDVTVLTFDCANMNDFYVPEGAGLPPYEILNGVRIIRRRPVDSLARLYQWWLRQPGGWRTTTWRFGQENWPLSLPSGLGVRRELSRLEADVVGAVNWGYGLNYWVCRPRRLWQSRRPPLVGVPVLHIDRPWAHNPFYKAMFAECAASIVFTDAEREFVEGCGARSVAVAGAGLDPARFDPARRDGAGIRARYGLGERPVVGFIGRQDRAKGVPTLIDAMRIVWRDRPDAVLLVAGQRAHREPVVHEMFVELSAVERERFRLIEDFSDDDGPSILDACDILALPSVEEAFGMVMIEAWMCGKPVIGADIASTRCIIDTGIDGYVATPFDPADLAAKILDLLADSSRRALFGERGRAKVLSRYTWDHVTDVWEATFRGAASANRR